MVVLKGDPALDMESRPGKIIATLSVASAFSTLAVLLRCYCRHVLLRAFGWDDEIMVAAQLGLGRHAWNMRKENFTPLWRQAKSHSLQHADLVLTNPLVFYSSIVVYNVASFLRHVTLGFLVLPSAWAVTLSSMLPLVCTPVESFWNRAVPGHCMNFKTVWYVMAGVNVATGFALFIMPIPVISSLQRPRG
ncbi:hypothetical protein B0T18DRAFT_389642 [Schizothecium vesticola]|uniref:Rhodopsin domain-containing protein n=1 Tax=Schizothecium vesticola TaxID=314040 RepID=A0AA40F2S9_9PEZI|nr:hypothetical protein B0T18DRAFT_389642 [Schizothecium vesticola]